SPTGLAQRTMVRIRRMSNGIASTSRRELMAGFGAAAIASALRVSSAVGRPAPLLRARADTIALGQGGPETAVWAFETTKLKLARTDVQEITFENGLPAPAVLSWRGISGAKAAEP